MDVVKNLTKENFKEKSHLFDFQKKIYEKVSMKLNIGNIGPEAVKIETYAIEKRLFQKNEKEPEREKIPKFLSNFQISKSFEEFEKKNKTPFFKK